MDVLAEYGRIHAKIGKWVAYFFGALMLVGGIVLLAMAAAGKIGDSFMRGGYIAFGAGLIVVAVIAIVSSTVVAHFTHKSKEFAAVSGGVGAFSDIVNVAGMAGGGGTARAPMMRMS